MLGEHGAWPVHRLHRAADRVAVVVGIVLSKTAARLHAVGGDPVDHGFVADNAVGPGKGGLDRRLVPGFMEECLVARVIVPHGRRARGERRLGGDHRRKDLVVDRQQLRRILRLVERFGDDEGYRVADIAHAALR